MNQPKDETLAQETCEACRVGAPTVSEEDAKALLQSLPDWAIEVVDGVPQLVRSYPFPDFLSALDFTRGVGELAESAGHHPAILTEWGKVTVRWWTHKIKGLHRNDFIMAAKTDRLAR